MNFSELFSMRICLTNEKIFKKGRPFPLHLAPVRQTPVQIWEVGLKNLWKKEKTEHPKCPETVDASGFAPDASILL